MDNNTCCGCVYENIDDTTENISKCVCCKRNVEYAKNDYYMRKEDEGEMKKRKCLKEHYIPYFDTICQVGRPFWRFDYIKTIHYCYFCNKVRVQRKLYFNMPKIFKKDDGLPF